MTRNTIVFIGLLGVFVLIASIFFFWRGPRVAGVTSSLTVHPGESLQAALSAAQPGMTILVSAGTYSEKLTSVRSGTAARPIILKAQGKVILVGEGSGRLFQLQHDYYRIEGFEWKGADVLLWLMQANHNVITKNFFHEAQGECVRAKYHSNYNLFSNNRIENCGREDFGDPGTTVGAGQGGKNGEGIYLGTAPEQLDRNPTGEPDVTSHNLIRHNVIKTNGNECVDIKEGATANVVEFNDCTGQKDPESGGFDSRGNGNVFRFNKSYNNAGAGIRLGGDTAADGIRNVVYGNQLLNNAGYGLKIMRTPQEKVCDNSTLGNRLGEVNEKSVVNGGC